MTVFVGGWWAYSHKLLNRAIETQRHEEASQAKARSMIEVLKPNIKPATDFTTGLPEAFPSAQFAAAIQQAGLKAGVSVQRVNSIAGQQRTATLLGRDGYELTLKGDYAGIKRVLGQLLSEFDNLSVKRLQMRYDAGQKQIEAYVVLTAWLAPLHIGTSESEQTSKAIAP